MRIVRIFLAVFLLAIAAGAIMLYVQAKKSGKGLESMTQAAQRFPMVKGALRSNAESGSPVREVADSASKVAQSTSSYITQIFDQLPQSATPGGEKIPIDQAAKQIQAQIEKLPSTIAERARYDYCRQVITDYELEHPKK